MSAKFDVSFVTTAEIAGGYAVLLQEAVRIVPQGPRSQIPPV